MEEIKFKKFIKISKFVVEFNKMGILYKLLFYIESPLRYLKFKKVYKEELKAKNEKKEVI